MSDADVEAVRLAMFVHSGVKAVDEPCLYRTSDGELGLSATVTVAAPDVDLAVVRATVEKVLEEQFGIREVDLWFKDPGPLPVLAPGGLLEKK
ncbi:hypothetical protein [Pseudoxanthomonas japonensis]|jgi:hypothetical protein|uniref:hypothetical protein n=1 Tax=Pseudoxanthomonas japonensis TaxID=69284 RepID=UPI00374A244B